MSTILHTKMQRDQDTTIDGARASLKREIDNYLTVAQTLRQQLNCFEPILSLPPEIMTIIFSLVRDASPHPLHWIQVTHVCTYWHQVAINAPGLWCRPPLANLPWTVEMLARSKQVDITLESDSHKHYPGQHEGYEEAFQHATRIRHISLDVSDSSSMEAWSLRVVDNLPIYTPHLETLSINIEHLGQGYPTPRIALINAPSLRRLQLSCCEPNWDALWLPQLTHLEITSISNSVQLTRRSFMATLRKMQNLESLILFDSFPSDTVTVDELDQAPLMNIYMVQLRVLYVWDKFLAVGNFFRYVTFPPEAAVHVTLSFGGEYPMDLESNAVRYVAILRNIAKSYSNAASSNIVFKNLVVDYPQEVSPQLCVGMFDGIFEESADKFGERRCFYSTLRSIRRGLTLIVETSMDRTSDSWFNILFRGIFSASFPLDNITHAHIRSIISLQDITHNPQLLPETVGLLPSLSFIKVSKLAGPWILRAAMYHASEYMGKPALSLLPFPRLESIHFHDVPFLPSSPTSRNRYARRWGGTSGFVDRELLQQFLVTRSDTLRRCQLEDCFHLTTEDVDELWEVVGDVVCWDEVELDEFTYCPELYGSNGYE